VPTSWTLPSGYWVYQNRDQIRALYHSAFPTFKTSDQLSYVNVFNVDERTFSLYGMADGEVSLFGRPLKAQGGVRYTSVDTKLDFTDQYSLAKTNASTGTQRFLPSATLRYELTDKLRMRFNFGKTLRRPDFGALNPAYNLTGDLTNVGYGSGSSGNANLKPTTSTNYDLALEWYFARGSAFYTTLFRRDVQGLVVSLANRVTVTGTGLNTTSFVVTQPQNASNGVLKGAEVGFTLFPQRLPGLLKGLGVQGSFTALDSSQNIPIADSAGKVVGQSTSSFFGVSKYSFNVTGAYERGPVGARLSYVWRSAFLANNEAALFANPIGVWRTPESSLDAQLTLNVNKRLGVTFDAVNLLKSVQQTYYKFGDKGNSQQYNLGTTLLSRTFALGCVIPSSKLSRRSLLRLPLLRRVGAAALAMVLGFAPGPWPSRIRQSRSMARLFWPNAMAGTRRGMQATSRFSPVPIHCWTTHGITAGPCSARINAIWAPMVISAPNSSTMSAGNANHGRG
jgi:TonB-dependent receptor